MAEFYRIFQASDVIKTFGFTPRQILHLVERSVVEPVIEADGTGSRRFYNYQNMLEFGLVKRFIDRGISSLKVKKIISDLKKTAFFESWADKWREGALVYYIMKNGSEDKIVSASNLQETLESLSEELESRGHLAAGPHSNISSIFIISLGTIKDEINVKADGRIVTVR